MEPRQDFDEADARALIATTAWQRYVMHLMHRLQGYSLQIIVVDAEQKAMVAACMGEIRYLIEHPYMTAQRDSPLQALHEQAWLREWLGHGPMIDRAQYAKFLAWQEAHGEPKAPEAPTPPNPWDRGDRPSSDLV